jgi:hypothetical protein
MRMLLITVLLVFVLGACSLVFDSKTSSTEYLPDASTTDDPQHDGGFGGSNDGGCNQYPDAGYGGDGGYAPDAAWPTGDAGWPNNDGGFAPDAGLWPDGGP